MEGRGDRATQPQSESVGERKQNFVKIERGSQDLSDILKRTMETDEIPEASRLRASVYSRKEVEVETVGLNVEELLKLAKERGWRVAIYNPGIAWSGDQWSKRETRDNPFFEKVKGGISKEEKVEAANKSAALDFLVEGGFDLAVTFDPVEAKGFVSSLRVDMVTRRETIK